MNDMYELPLRGQLLGLGRTPESGGLQLIDTNAQAWFVECGTVDVFIVSAQVGAITGARTHLFSVGAGQLLVFPCIAGERQSLAALPGPDTRYVTIERDTLCTFLRLCPRDDALTVLIDNTVEMIGARFPNAALKASVLVKQGSDCTSDLQPVSVRSEAPGTWLELGTGQASYVDGNLPSAKRYLPLPFGAWITLAEHTQANSRSTLAVCRDALSEDVLEGIEELFSALFHAALRQQRSGEVEEVERLRLKGRIDNKVMADALDSFVCLFGANVNAFEGSSTSRTFDACKIIGSHMGIVFKAPPPASEGAMRRNPVKEIAQASGVRTRRVALKGEWWSKDNGDLLVFLEQGKLAYALLPGKSGHYQAVDPVTHERTSVTAQFAATLAPFGYVFYAALPAKKLALGDILSFVFPTIRREIKTVAAIGLGSAFLGMAIPIASGQLFDTVFPAADYNQMVQIVLMLFVTSVVTLLFEATRSLTMLRIEGTASNALQAAVWDRVLGLPVPFFREYTAGDLATRINGINEIRQVLSGTVISSVISNLFSALNIFLLFYYSVKLAIAAMLLVAIAITVNVTIGFFSISVTRKIGNMNGRLTGLVLEYLSGITKLRITGAESRAFANWAAGFAAQKRLALRSGALANMSAVFGAAFPVAASAVLFVCVGVTLSDAEAQRFSTGDFIAFGAAWSIFLGAALSLVRNGIDLLSVASIYERTRPILEAIPEVDEGKAYPGRLDGAIELSHISFSYAPDSPVVLDDLSLSIRPGEFVALVGASGSGKSTLLRMMLGFEVPTKGGVYYDGQHLADVDIGAIRRQVGVVLQGGRLMSGDIYTNIVGSSTLKLADAWDAARACGLDQDIEAMPMGMHTNISDGGGTLSGGQRQRLLIARAIATKPRIIFFDEATSALDNQSQAIVSASMEKLQATRVVIAHRLSTIINADCIYVLEKGKIVQSGSYQQLIEEAGLFSELAKRQIA